MLLVYTTSASSLFTGAAVQTDRFRTAVEQQTEGMVAIGAGTTQDIDLHRGQHAVVAGAEGHSDPHRVTDRRPLKLFPSAHLVTDRSAGAQDGERNQILGEDFLLPPNPPPTRRVNTRTRS